jgi:Thioesterase-like superfamily
MSYFRASTRDDRQVLEPLDWARSGWAASGQIRGTAISGALAMAAERVAAGLEGSGMFRPVRWTVDLFRPAAMIPSTTYTRVVRNGRRLRLVDSVFAQEGAEVARGSLLLLAVGGAARGRTWTGPAPQIPPVPGLRTGGTERTLFFSEGTGWTTNPADHTNAARKATWHLPVPVVEGTPPSPFQHVATVADSSNLVTNFGTAGVEFINTDLTLALTRLPDEAAGIGLMAAQRAAGDGAALGSTTVFDDRGPLGMVLVSALANGTHAVNPGTVVF